jgi:hypothetical protein
MDIIPYARLVLALSIGGLLIYIFNNVLGIVNEYFPNTTTFGSGVWILWHAAIFVVMIVESVRFIMHLQRRQVIE